MVLEKWQNARDNLTTPHKINDIGNTRPQSRPSTHIHTHTRASIGSTVQYYCLGAAIYVGSATDHGVDVGCDITGRWCKLNSAVSPCVFLCGKSREGRILQNAMHDTCKGCHVPAKYGRMTLWLGLSEA